MTGPQDVTPRLDLLGGPEPHGRTDTGDEALRRLRLAGYLALWDVSCEVRGDRLRLLGRLPSYYLKQVAQAIVAEVEGVRRVDNLIEVVSPVCRTNLGRDRGPWAGAAVNTGSTR